MRRPIFPLGPSQYPARLVSDLAVNERDHRDAHFAQSSLQPQIDLHDGRLSARCAWRTHNLEGAAQAPDHPQFALDSWGQPRSSDQISLGAARSPDYDAAIRDRNRAMNNESSTYSIDVSVVSKYLEHESAPAQDRYVFAYTVTIRNVGETPARLMTRHWIITDAGGNIQEVRGDGVVGEQPRLEPGQGFQYTSAAMIQTPVGSMEGSYQMVAEDGVKFDAEIPPFSLAVRRALH